jgi:hypothetical protein
LIHPGVIETARFATAFFFEYYTPLTGGLRKRLGTACLPAAILSQEFAGSQQQLQQLLRPLDSTNGAAAAVTKTARLRLGDQNTLLRVFFWRQCFPRPPILCLSRWSLAPLNTRAVISFCIAHGRVAPLAQNSVIMPYQRPANELGTGGCY